MKKSGFIYRNKIDIYYLENQIANEEISEKLLEINCNENSYKIIPNSFSLNYDQEYGITFKSQNCSWFIYKPSKTTKDINKYKLNEGEIIKIGRINLRIKKIKINSNSNNINKSYSTITQNNIKINNNNNTTTNQNNNELEKKITLNDKNNLQNSKIKIKKKKICRICYTDDDTDENPLIQPCNCSGTMKFIHINCLEKWISTRSCIEIDKNNNCSVYIIKEVECELCKSKLPDFVNHKGKLFEILNLNCDYENYIIVESLTIDKHRNKFLYIINLDNKNIINVGRGRNSDLLLSDISVSRIHCKIIKDKNDLFICDNDSKFGTLILIQSEFIKIHNFLSLYIQVGRTFFEIFIKKPNSCFNCCETIEKEDYFYYQIQNRKGIIWDEKLTIKQDDIEDNNNDDNETESDLNSNNNHGLKVIEIDNKINNDDDNDNDKGILLRSKDSKRFNRKSILPDVENFLLNQTTQDTNKNIKTINNNNNNNSNNNNNNNNQKKLILNNNKK